MRMLWIVFTGLLMSSGNTVYAGDAVPECEKIKQKIRYIQSKMRAGYTRAQGEKMEAELRRLRSLRAKACR
jgi:hypothetical protein